MIGELKGKIAFITGAAGGIGLGMAKAFADAGMMVAIADIDEAALNQAAGALRQSGSTILVVPLDVTSPSSWALAVEKTADLGPVQLLCNNAGVSTFGMDVGSLTPDLWDKVVAINLNSMFYGLHFFGPQMKKAGSGHIVNTGSIGGLFGGVPGASVYTATKFAVVGMSEGLRAELKADGIGVSVLCPGPVRSRLSQTSQRVHGRGTSKSQAAVGAASPDAIDPDLIGLRVLEAVRTNEFYIITHPELRLPVAHRNEELMTAFDRGESFLPMLRPTPEDRAAAKRAGEAFAEFVGIRSKSEHP